MGRFLQATLSAAGWSETQIAEIVAVASTNYMYNTFFKFRVLGGTDRFEGFPVGLRAHTFSGTSLEESTVEVINLAISDINACGPCVSGHVAKAEQLGLSHEAMLEAIQCAATVYAGQNSPTPRCPPDETVPESPLPRRSSTVFARPRTALFEG
ncbi:MAG: carboxymuconolactone decarboxylase family protein [Planctomycetaceae bacterium]